MARLASPKFRHNGVNYGPAKIQTHIRRRRPPTVTICLFVPLYTWQDLCEAADTQIGARRAAPDRPAALEQRQALRRDIFFLFVFIV